MASVDSIKRKILKLNLLIIFVSVASIFILQIILNRLEFSKIGHYLYPDFWNDPHYIFKVSSVAINIAVPLLCIYFFTRHFYKKEILNNIKNLNTMIQSLKNKDLDHKIERTNIKEFNDIINEIEAIKKFLRNNIKMQLTVQNNFKRKLEIFEHDLKTPLTVLQGHAELLKKINVSNLSQEEKTNKINLESDILLKSIDRINNQINMHINNVKLLPKDSDRVSIKEVVEVINNNYKHNFMIKDKKFEILADASLLNKDYFISNQILYHVMDNLINNAVKYSENQIIIKLNLSGTHRLNFQVINDGKLFTKEDLAHAKEWGIKGEVSKGSGIGLYFASEVLQQFNSDIMLENIKEKASASFTIDIELE
ncbi:sensor histidine kinase [Staphylococcus felis]|uniref:sensor histidine kinase n=1 Tax=Staphylococcus felis TaxID=46127 RepID=UPI002481568E|nr:HAMP domain-containing sensor histidine kinase [Staphylococcus felis]